MWLLTQPRWKRFVGVITDIEEHVQLWSVGKTTNYTQHMSGMWHVSVDSKFTTVNVRRSYEDSRAGSSLKPTRVGIALTYFNWEKLKKAIIEVEDKIPAMLAVSPCWHESQIHQMICHECSPFHKVEDIADVKAAEAAEKLMVDNDSNTSDGAVDFTQHPLFSTIE